MVATKLGKKVQLFKDNYLEHLLECSLAML